MVFAVKKLAAIRISGGVMNTSDNSLAIRKLLRTPGLGPAKVNALLDWGRKAGRTAAEMCRQPDLLRARLTPEQIQSIELDESDVAEQLSANNIELVSVVDEAYPKLLRVALKGRTPPLLYCRGNIDLMNVPAVGFCGSRKASEKGIETARDCAEQLAEAKFAVVSGYAAGVDITTHVAALKTGGTTIIVLPEGILRFRVKHEIKDVWDWNRVLVISHFDARLPWSVQNAMARNSVICGLSQAMILIEAGLTGGSIAAGRTCLEIERPLFAPVYEGMPESAAGNQLLLTQGALPLLKSKTSGRAAIAKVLRTVEPVRL